MEWAFLGLEIANAYVSLLELLFGKHHWTTGLFAFLDKAKLALESFAVAE